MTHVKAPWLGAIALMVAAGIALSACGGGGGLNEDEAAGLRGELDAALAEAAASEAAKQAAEQARAAAEAAQKAAETKAAADVAAANAAKETAEAAQKAAETDKAAAELAQKAAEASAMASAEDAKKAAEAAATAVKVAEDANADLLEAQKKQKAAEDARDAAQDALTRAQLQLTAAERAAEAQRQAAERAQQAAEAAREQAEQERDAAQQQVTRADARLVLEGLATDIQSADVTVVPRHNAVVRITSITPATTFVNPTAGSLQGWRKTAFAKNVRPNIDRLEVYSNVEAPTYLPFRDSDYNDGITAGEISGVPATDIVAPFETGAAPSVVIDQQGKVVGWLDIPDGARVDATSSAFPRTSGLPMTYTLIDRGEWTTVQRDQDPSPVPENYRGPFRNPEVDPQRYEFERSGTLGGANGTFRCAAATLTTCSVQNTGNSLVFAGPWTFRPSSAGSRVRIADEAYMYFGWWSRHATATPAWSFHTFHEGHEAGDISGVTGSASYRGPAAGYYAIYEPNAEGSEYGDFTATASLTADFSNNWVQGTVDQFSGHPDWSLTLERLVIAPSSGSTTDLDNSVTWTINNTPAETDESWEAEFYSNIAPADRTGRNNIMPSGIAGTFKATYDDIGRLTGAFGAHCIDVVCRP